VSDNIHRLTTNPDTIKILEEALAEAKAGTLLEVIVLGYTTDPDDPWSYHIGPTRRLTAWIGHLEMTKQDWIEGARSNR
jgi:hypothetical protein